MKIILVRHGKAEQSFSKRDFERNLTLKGKQDVREKAKRLERTIDNTGILYILTSSANRAKQTAEIILEELNQHEHSLEFIEDISIYHGQKDLLEACLLQLEDQDSLLVVGHQPTLSYWAENLCGQNISFTTGDMAAFDIKSLKPLKADFLWQID